MKIVVTPEEQTHVEQVMESITNMFVKMGSEPTNTSEALWKSESMSALGANEQDIKHFLRVLTSYKISVNMEGELDTILLEEIGKAYKTQYETFHQEGNKEMMDRTFGAMSAIRKVMDMAKDPAY